MPPRSPRKRSKARTWNWADGAFLSSQPGKHDAELMRPFGLSLSVNLKFLLSAAATTGGRNLLEGER